MYGALAEFERNLIRERTKAGLAGARAQEGAGSQEAGSCRPALSFL